jgi:hypothetical protein
MAKKTYTGLTTTTKKHLLLGAGAFFRNFLIGTDTYESAVAGGKLIGATQGGGEFQAVATFRQIPVDGAIGDVKDLEDIQRWDVSMTANVLEVTKETLQLALGAATIGTTSGTSGYKKITGNNGLAAADFNTVTWCGCLLGETKPMLIQIDNALCTNGLNLTFTDGEEGKIALEFHGFYDAVATGAEPVAPFSIYMTETTT